MTNLINAHVNNNNNVNAAKRISSPDGAKGVNPRAILAPDTFPKYSMHESFNKKDEFRKNVRSEIYENNQRAKRRKNALTKFALATAAVIGYFVLKGKK